MHNSPFWKSFGSSKIVSPLIGYSDELIEGKPVFISSNSYPIKSPRHYEAAGHSFHILALKYLGDYSELVPETESQGGHSQSSTPHSGSFSIYPSGDQNHFESFSNGVKNSDSSKRKSGRGFGQNGLSEKSTLEDQDHYATLHLGHLRFLATEEQIRKSYRDAALRLHPDKLAPLVLAEPTEGGKLRIKEEIESKFQSIQVAYGVLNDKAKRRVYDSTDLFDDTIPNECPPSCFYELYGPVFMRNAKWSIDLNVPSLGVETTPIDEVDQFYKFWYGFKSWREFPSEEDYDINETESRNEKRWAERMNARRQEKSKKAERVRILTLVNNAYKRDPRIKKRSEEDKLEKKRRKEMKNQGKKTQEEEARKAAEEERIQKEKEAKLAAEEVLNRKKLKEKEKRLLRKERSRLRTLSASVVSKKRLGVSQDDVEKICMSFEKEQLQLLSDSVDGKGDSEKALLIKQALQDGGNNDNDNEKPNPNGFVTKVKLENPLTTNQETG